MLIREFVKGDAASVAAYSDCERYRYMLERVWADGPRLLYVMLNPSKATEVRNDPTVERCERRARALGFGGMRVANLFAWRATDPADLRRAEEPVGADNDAAIREAAGWADEVLCGWGAHGTHLARGDVVERMLRGTGRRLTHLGVTRQGLPRHPLYVGYAKRPEAWVIRG